MLELQDVSFAYNKNQPPAVAGVSCAIGRGEFVAVAGRNGSGKTTLTKLLMSLLKPSAGRVLLDGRDTTALTPAAMARHIGYVFQNPDRQMFRDTVRAEIAYGPEMLGFSPAETAAAVAEAMDLAQVTDLADCYPRTLAKSRKQQVAIASALAMRPDFLVLDEPTSGQDAAVRERFMQLLGRFYQAGKTVILVTHDMDLLARYAERVVVMDRGSKVYDGAVADCFSDRKLLHAAGLREPAAVSVSRSLAPAGIAVTADIGALAAAILAKRGGAHG
ncbi:MAG: ABC transporter ATP-binding protein [Sporomusaceae bacterium]|nr:ABC transporter ATP-binding protein [Sporomusaceae bacterium]